MSDVCPSQERIFTILQGTELPKLYDGEFGLKRNEDGSEPALFLGSPAGDIQIPLGFDTVKVEFTGDVLISNERSVIVDSAVSNPKLAYMPSMTLKGNDRLIPGEPRDLTMSQIRTMIDVSDYRHPTGDGNSHVPATSTIHGGKVLMAGNTPNSAYWGELTYSSLGGAPIFGDESRALHPGDIGVAGTSGMMSRSDHTHTLPPYPVGNATHTGDVTGDRELTISNSSVTNIKMANMPANTIKARRTIAGAPEDLTITQFRSFLNVAEGANNYKHPDHTGDVTSIGDGQLTITDRAIINSKLADMSPRTVKGNMDDTLSQPSDLSMPALGGMLYTSTNITAKNSLSTDDTLLVYDYDASSVRRVRWSDVLQTVSNSGVYVHPNHTGDVISDGDGLTTIDRGVVSNFKLADMPGDTLKGRLTTAGQPEDLDPVTIRTMLNIEDGANHYYHPDHTGDITSTGDGETRIAAKAVHNAKLADMPADSIKGRLGTMGEPRDLSLDEVRALIGQAVPGPVNTTPLNTVGSDGTALEYARADHMHPIPAGTSVANLGVTSTNLGDQLSNGTATTAARSDHRHPQLTLNQIVAGLVSLPNI